jgi:hypothetical protein
MGVITSTGNPAVKAARKLARRPRRDQARAFLVEGPQAVREALDHLERLFVTAEGRHRAADLVASAQARNVDILAVTDTVLASIADTVTPQGLVGVASLPDPDLDTARRILTWIQRNGQHEFSRRDVLRGCRTLKASDLDAPLQILEDHGWIRPSGQPAPTVGRPRAPAYVVHTEALR